MALARWSPVMPIPVTSCVSCPCGKAAGIGTGGQCPFVQRQRAAGEYVYFQGEPADRTWFLKSGTVVLTRRLGGDDVVEYASGVRGPGSFLGLETLVQGAYLETARVTAAASICGAPREYIDQWLGPPTHPARMALDQLLKTIAHERPRGARPDGTAVRRVARWLMTDAGPRTGEAHVPRQYVANLLGMVPETLSRALAQLAQLGAVSLTRKTVRISDPDLLRDAAEG